MKWRHSKEAQAQKDKEQKEPAEKAAGGALTEVEAERSPSRSEGESESSEAESLDLEPGSDTERTEAGATTEQPLQRHPGSVSSELYHPAGSEVAAHTEPPLVSLGLEQGREPPSFGLRDSP